MSIVICGDKKNMKQFKAYFDTFSLANDVPATIYVMGKRSAKDCELTKAMVSNLNTAGHYREFIVVIFQRNADEKIPLIDNAFRWDPDAMVPDIDDLYGYLQSINVNEKKNTN